MKRFTRGEIKERFGSTIKRGEPILICAAGLGMVAHYAEMGSVDMLAFYSSAYWRLQGFETVISDCHVGDCNKMNVEMAERMNTVTDHTPFMAGVLCTDNFWDWDEYFELLKTKGYSAVMNFPTNGMQTGEWRYGTDTAGLGLPLELKTLEKAVDHDLYTVAVAFDADDAQILAGNIDALLYHLGTRKRDIAMPLKEAAILVNKVIERVHKINPDILVFVTGGPVINPQDTAFMYEHTGAVGYFAEESIDSRVIMKSVADAVRSFTSKKLRIR